MRIRTIFALGTVTLLACGSRGGEELGETSSALSGQDPAAPRGTSTASRNVPATCARPTTDLCKNEEYLRSECGPACGDILKPQLDAYLAAAPRSRKMWPSGKPADAPNLKSAPFFPHVPAGMLQPIGTDLDAQLQQISNQFRREPLAETPAEIDVLVKKAEVYRRNPLWERNGEQINSCEEYAYEKYNDYSRYQDAVAACNGNKSCIFKVTYSSGPGIANRTLKRTDQQPIVPQPPQKPGDVVAYSDDAPKNAFYRTGGTLMKGIAGMFPNYPHVANLAAELDGGQHYWNSGLPGADRIKHATDFDRLDFIQKKAASTSIEESEELELRAAKIDELYEKYAAALTATGACTIKNKYADLFDASGAPSSATTIDTMNSGGLFPSWRATAATCDNPNQDFSIPLLRTLSATTETVNGVSEPRLACPADAANQTAAERARNAGCRLADAVLVEWNRKQRGGGGCFQAGYYGCDFSPSGMVERYAAADAYAEPRGKDYARCIEATGGKFAPQPNLTIAEIYIQQKLDDQGPMKVEAKQIQPGRFGQILSKSETWGEPDLFSASYDAYLGWGLESLQVTSGYSDPSKNDVPCKMGGFARAQVTAEAHTIVDPLIDAYSIYNDPMGIPWATRWNNLANAEGWVTLGELRGKFDDNAVPVPKQYTGTDWPTSATAAGWKTGKKDDYARALFHLTIAGEQLFDEYAEVALNQTYQKTLLLEKYNTPKLETSFWIGPVPITLGVWGTVHYGAFFIANAEAPKTCVYPPTLYKVDATINPWVRADAGAQAGVGIAGVASGGIRGYLTLLSANLPLTAYAELKATGQNDFAIDLGMKSKLTGRTLDGRLAIYAQALGIDVFEEEIFRWHGYKFDQPIFDVKTTFPLGGLGFPVQ